MALDETGAFPAEGLDDLSRVSDEASGHRALVAVPETGDVERPCPYSRGPAAPFLAHLIATARHEPQTRERCRAKPEAAALAYAVPAARLHGFTDREI